jgi:hypothetical protein
VNCQSTATVLVPRHRAELSWPPCGAGRRNEWHSIPALGRGSQIVVYSNSRRHARTNACGEPQRRQTSRNRGEMVHLVARARL